MGGCVAPAHDKKDIRSRAPPAEQPAARPPHLGVPPPSSVLASGTRPASCPGLAPGQGPWTNRGAGGARGRVVARRPPKMGPLACGAGRRPGCKGATPWRRGGGRARGGDAGAGLGRDQRRAVAAGSGRVPPPAWCATSRRGRALRARLAAAHPRRSAPRPCVPAGPRPAPPYAVGLGPTASLGRQLAGCRWQAAGMLANQPRCVVPRAVTDGPTSCWRPRAGRRGRRAPRARRTATPFKVAAGRRRSATMPLA